MMQVQLIYDGDCRNVREARRLLSQAFAAVKLTPHWDEMERGKSESPSHVRDFGSPTILVNGKDVAPSALVSGGGACRVYSDKRGKLSGTPPLEDIVGALSQALGAAQPVPPNTAAFKQSASALPAIGLALLPKLTCAACWPAYAGLLSGLGMGFFDYTPYLLPLTAVFLLLTLAALGYRARDRRGFAPLALGGLAATIVLIGKFQLDSDAALYAGIALLVGASLWNVWPKAVRESCPACVPDASRSTNEHRPEGVQTR